MKKILILGGTGRTSSILTKLCISAGYDVTISTRGKHKVSNDISSAKLIVLNRDNESEIKSLLSERYYDVVFDFSGYLPQWVDWVLSSVKTEKYIYVSSFESYARYHKGFNLREDDLPIFNKAFESNVQMGESGWYARGKFNSELLIANKYPDINYAIVRIPFVMSIDKEDYNDKTTSRILRYVLPIVKGVPLNDNNLERRYSFTDNTDEANFLVFLSQTDFKGVVNFASEGFVSMRDIVKYAEEKLGGKAVFDVNAENLPFTAHPEVTMDISRCKSLGYIPLKLDEWLWDKVDNYIDDSLQIANKEEKEIFSKIAIYTGLHFTNSNNYFYEKIMNGKIFLYVKSTYAKRGIYAVTPLKFPLIKGQKYNITTNFELKTKASVFNIHIYNSQNHSFQVILSHKVQPLQDTIDESKMFIPREENFDSIMVGAAHLLGEEAYISFNHLLINEI